MVYNESEVMEKKDRFLRTISGCVHRK